MNIHVELTPTQREVIQRRKNFHAKVAAKAAELAQRNSPLEALRVIAAEPVIWPVIPETDVLPSWAEQGRFPTMRQIQQVVCKFYGKQLSDMLSRHKTSDIVLPRQMAMYLCKEWTVLSILRIGASFDRDHTTVLHAIRKIDGLVKSDPNYAATVQLIKAQMEARFQ